MTAALSMGDLGVILLFADAERATLPMQLYRLMQAYRQDDAAGAALLLLLLQPCAVLGIRQMGAHQCCGLRT